MNRYISNLESIKEYCELVGLSFEYLNKLFGILQGISAGCQTISSFLVRLQELDKLFEGTVGTRPSQKLSHITLSTFHSSKGLEYDCVFMIDLNNSEIPGDKALDKVLENKDNALLDKVWKRCGCFN